MAFPRLLQKLFENDGQGPLLRADIIPVSLTRGMIMLWSGKYDDIPEHWALCDGSNGTPDLRGRFVYGSNYGDVPLGSIGGSPTHTHTGSTDTATPTGTASSATQTGTVAAATLSVAQLPSHRHTLIGSPSGDGPGSYAHIHAYGTQSTSTVAIGTTGSGSSHTHGFTGAAHTHPVTTVAHSHAATINPANNLPPYYALAYIMYLGS